jgi:formylglycine-generating enzyme required for sulfatase activity
MQKGSFLYREATRLVRSVENIYPDACLLRNQGPDPMANLAKPVDSKTVGDAIQLVDIPAGKFRMGGTFYVNVNQGAFYSTFSSYPEREVKLDAFKMSKFETTFGQWTVVQTWAAGKGYDLPKGSMGKSSSKDPAHPAAGVSWHDAAKWCNALSEMENKTPCYYTDVAMKEVYRKGVVAEPHVKWDANGYRLPTEAQWEYAALGGQDRANYWGDNTFVSSPFGWTQDARGAFYQSGRSLGNYMGGDSGGTTHPVGQKIGNQFGLYDMFGNVWEWCNDWIGPYEILKDQTVNPHGPESVDAVRKATPEGKTAKFSKESIGERALRGWAYNAAFAATCTWGIYNRASEKPESAADSLGFRVVTNAGK